jgi:hypothetical protein
VCYLAAAACYMSRTRQHAPPSRGLPPGVLGEEYSVEDGIPPPRAARAPDVRWAKVKPATAVVVESASRPSYCGWILLLLLLQIVTVIGLVVYIAITETRLNQMDNQIDKLEPTSMSSSTAAARSGELELAAHRPQQLRVDATNALFPASKAPPPAPPKQLPAPPQPSAKPTSSAVRPAWASALVPRWLQFETPLSEEPVRLPADGVVFPAAGTHDYRVECNFGADRAVDATAHVQMEFRHNDETGEDYAVVRVQNNAYQGRSCVLAWMGE